MFDWYDKIILYINSHLFWLLLAIKRVVKVEQSKVRYIMEKLAIQNGKVLRLANVLIKKLYYDGVWGSRC